MGYEGATEYLRRQIAAAWRRGSSQPLVVGICGSQGSGKSTLARALQRSLQQRNALAVAVLSLDDLYMSGAARARLGQNIHPLLRTRGVPGTHDIALGISIIQHLTRAGDSDVIRLPRFAKERDEPVGESEREEFRGRADVVLFEGWCVGARAQPPEALLAPLNELERVSDGDGRWRHYVNEQLKGTYAQLFDLLDMLIVLQAPDFNVVARWRSEQERQLRAAHAGLSAQAGSAIMGEPELQRFVMHYERITRHMLSELPSRADIVLQLDAQRTVITVHGPSDDATDSQLSSRTVREGPARA